VRLDPDSASLTVRTYREGIAARAGHDLVIEVTRWEATVDLPAGGDEPAIELRVDPRSLEVREGLRGVKPLSAADRREIRRTIDEKVLRGQPIGFRSRGVQVPDGAGVLAVEGDLSIGAATRPLSARLDVGADARVTGTIVLTQSEFGITPFRGLMGALNVRDDVEVVIDARLPRDSEVDAASG
jgi:polyisoprenoid-binding protein YceI